MAAGQTNPQPRRTTTAAQVAAAFVEYLGDAFGDHLQDGQPTAALDRWIALALRLHAASPLAAAYLAAHLITLDKDEDGQIDGGAGLLIGDRIGPLGLQYQMEMTEGGESWFERTPYGRMFRQLERRTPATAMAIGVYG